MKRRNLKTIDRGGMLYTRPREDTSDYGTIWWTRDMKITSEVESSRCLKARPVEVLAICPIE
jgi:hypothetical protein